MLFVEKQTGRNLSMLLRLTREERDFLREQATRRGVTVLTLLRQCLRDQLLIREKQRKVS